ncbi:MAG: hypothetical protein F6K54_33095 [Okeania sp. SIO3B5]|uniref:hypothetical protein n=1 Tax=Okeania sp. SIO3B5 TaxID=2607811 RepID=UPI001400F89A|nr:hypothetical protein [Okeania sp. SIO3B5]NEO57488.1 hypothetical protein [Okeania sp. SIO3B5]
MQLPPYLLQQPRLLQRLSPRFLQQLETAYLSGIEQGRQLGKTQAVRMEIIESVLKFRFNSLDDELREIIQPMSSLSSEEFTPLLLKLSREELLARFNSKN